MPVDLTQCGDPARRHDFILLFDCTDGNPNGDPDAGNLPRVDPETMQGLVTDVCLKRKVRNYVQDAASDTKGFEIYVREKAVLSAQHKRAYEALGADATIPQARRKMCDLFYDVRMFGAVMSLKESNAGQVRGPIQFTFARSVSPVVPMDVSITRMAVATEREALDQKGDNRTMGRKTMIPYGLYIGHGFFSPKMAEQTGVTRADLEMFWNALMQMWDHDRSAARGLMACRGLYVFTHDHPLGNAPANQLFDRLEVTQKTGVAAPRRLGDYNVLLNRELPAGITLTPLVEA